jgi:hypothetical protein
MLHLIAPAKDFAVMNHYISSQPNPQTHQQLTYPQLLHPAAATANATLSAHAWGVSWGLLLLPPLVQTHHVLVLPAAPERVALLLPRWRC